MSKMTQLESTFQYSVKLVCWWFNQVCLGQKIPCPTCSIRRDETEDLGSVLAEQLSFDVLVARSISSNSLDLLLTTVDLNTQVDGTSFALFQT